MLKHEFIEKWLDDNKSIKLHLNSDKNLESIENMIQISGKDIRKIFQSSDEISYFIERIFELYDKKSKKINIPGLVYAWFDEMADQLRISFIHGIDREELPFGAKLCFIDDTDMIAKKIYEEGHSVISWKELQCIDLWDDIVDCVGPEEKYILEIFVKNVGE